VRPTLGETALQRQQKKASENQPSLVVEGCPFENKERVMEAIHDLATRLQFELKKHARKRVRSRLAAAVS
jgi:uncharacterized membrane protein YdbT with pleckstrin-like domain